MFPCIVYDNFFEDPDLVVDLANSLEYEPGDGSWPGVTELKISEIMIKSLKISLLIKSADFLS